jgi:hypothetical protein
MSPILMTFVDGLICRLKYLAAGHLSLSGTSFLHGVMNRLESIKFAADWKRKGRELGGNTFKRAFARSIYFARTGRDPPTKYDSKEDRKEFRVFRARHQLVITGRNCLLELYNKVRCLPLCSQIMPNNFV